MNAILYIANIVYKAYKLVANLLLEVVFFTPK